MPACTCTHQWPWWPPAQFRRDCSPRHAHTAAPGPTWNRYRALVLSSSWPCGFSTPASTAAVLSLHKQEHGQQSQTGSRPLLQANS